MRLLGVLDRRLAPKFVFFQLFPKVRKSAVHDHWMILVASFGKKPLSLPNWEEPLNHPYHIHSPE